MFRCTYIHSEQRIFQTFPSLFACQLACCVSPSYTRSPKVRNYNILCVLWSDTQNKHIFISNSCRSESVHVFMAQLLVKIGALYNHLCEEIKSYLSDPRSSIREFVISLPRCNHAMFLSSLPSIHAQTTPKLQLSYIDQTIHICCHIMQAMLLHVIY